MTLELAAYRSRAEESRGRLHEEAESETRTPFQRDRDRIIHSAAFRRLQYKTQVFVYHEGDHYRTRLTHTLEVAQIARSVSRSLGLDPDLAEAIALAHDLGHPPFGHAGEEALDAAMTRYGGFDHNAQTLRILTRLEHRYANFDGLNLTWETLEGTVKHNGPLQGPRAADGGAKRVPRAILDYVAQHDLELETFPGPEAQIAALCDDIAYNNHDIDDGLRAELFSIADLEDVPLAGPVFHEVAKAYPGIERTRHIHESIRRMIDRWVRDLVAESRRRAEAAKPDSAAAVRALGAPLAGFSDEMAAANRDLKIFLHENMYRHYKVNRMTSKARRIVRDLAAFYLAEPECLPAEWQTQAQRLDQPSTARLVADFIAGMTDRYALAEHDRYFVASANF